MGLRDLRVRRRLTQNEAAILLGISRNALGACERGARALKLTEIDAFSRIYKVPIEAVYTAAVETLNGAEDNRAIRVRKNSDNAPVS